MAVDIWKEKKDNDEHQGRKRLTPRCIIDVDARAHASRGLKF